MKSVDQFFKEVGCEHGFIKYIGGDYPFYCDECKGCWEHHPHDTAHLVEELLERTSCATSWCQGDQAADSRYCPTCRDHPKNKLVRGDEIDYKNYKCQIEWDVKYV